MAPNQIELAPTAAVADAASADEAVMGEVAADELAPLNTGWRLKGGGDSLEHLHSSVLIADADSHWFMKLASFAGVGIMVSVGYMDPGNWSTNLVGGAAHGYILLAMVLLSSLVAMFLQGLSLKLGVATDRDLVSLWS
jgi:manganese transport protein